MPEDNKATPATGGKKESFTFSDKIKASQTAAPKSFANRLSSKIGKDGKPKQTIFERTKRDAPFLIAALVALLLLPFLYKYSGSVSDAPMITPSSEDSIFDPDAERYAFSPDMDPDGQIAQLAGRDSLDLIGGLGGKEPEVQGEMEDYDYSRDGFASSDDRKASASDTNVDIEENTTNIYKKRAKAATRAAFKRATTPIKGIPGASLRVGAGDKLAVGNWGGRLKEGAKKVKGDSPKSSPKPVSLQPLRPTGTPQRSAYGNPAAAMRQAKDALSKADAKQGLMDAMVKPVEPGSFGGLGLGDGSVGGSGGKMDRNFSFNGKEPWWWDLMKTRSQMQWQKEFERKWDWITWGDKIAQNILKGLINCLVTGNSDGDPDSFLGTGGGASGKEAKCCGLNEKKFKIKYAKEYEAAKGNFETACGAVKSGDEGKKICPSGWVAGREGKGPRKGIVATRLNCLGLAIGGKYGVGNAVLTEDSAGGECEDLLITEPYKFRVVPQGKAQKWHTYHWIVAHNFVPLEYTQDKANAKGILLCSEGSDHLQMSSHYSSMGATDYLTTEKKTFEEEYQAYEKAKKKETSLTFTAYLAKKYQLDSATSNEISEREALLKSADEQQKEDLLQKMCDLAYDYSEKATVHTTKKQRILGDIYPRTDDLCVIYLAQGNQLEYGQFQKNTIDMLKGLIENSKGMIVPQGQTAQQMAEKAFKQLDLAFIEAASMKQKLGYAKWGESGNKLEEPILYDRFENAYIIHRGVTASATGSREDVNKRKYRLEDEEYVRSQKCNFDADVHLECTDNSLPPFATVRKGKLASHPVGDIQVTAHFNPSDKSEKITVADFKDTIKANQSASTYPFVYTALKEAIPAGKNAEGSVEWKVNYTRDGQPFAQTRTCVFSASGEPAPDIPEPKCTDGEIKPLDKVDADGCNLQQKCVNGQWIEEKVDKNCPQQRPPVGASVWFYPTLSKMPQKVLQDAKDMERPALDNNELVKEWPQCKVDEVSGMHLEFYDKETHAYMKDIIATYTAANGGKTTKPMEEYVKQTNNTPTIAQVVDAMRIGQALGKKDVPKNTVCAVARTIGHYSRDPHTQGLTEAGNRPMKYSNTFGTFAAYMGYDSSFFPTMRLTDTKSGNNRAIDYRYHGCWDKLRTNAHIDQQVGAAMNADKVNLGGPLGICGSTHNGYKGADKECSGFHYGHYNWNHHVQHDLAKAASCDGDKTGKACLQDDREPYEDILDASIWGANGARFPLKALETKKGSPIFIRQWGKQHQGQYRNGTIDSYNRTQYHNNYKSIFHRSDVSCGYDSTDTMSVDDAIRYIGSLCDNGMERKPGNGGEIPCDHFYLADHAGQ